MKYIHVETFKITIDEKNYIYPELIFIKNTPMYSTIINININDINEFKLFSTNRKEEIIEYLKTNNEIFIENKNTTFMFHIDEEFIKIESSTNFFTTDLWFENNILIKNEIKKLYQ